MPWSDVPDPVPELTPRERVVVIVQRASIVIAALIILGICASSWFRASAVQF